MLRQTIIYLKQDLNSLYEVLVKVNKQIFMDYNLDLTDSSTISSLALKFYLSKYYKKNIPIIDKTSMYRDIRDRYFGGITEVYKPYGENLYYYDVNSLCPYVAFQDMPGLNCVKESFYQDKNIDDLFGFFYCKIEIENNYLGVLPVINKNNRVYFPM